MPIETTTTNNSTFINWADLCNTITSSTPITNTGTVYTTTSTPLWVEASPISCSIEYSNYHEYKYRRVKLTNECLVFE